MSKYYNSNLLSPKVNGKAILKNEKINPDIGLYKEAVLAGNNIKITISGNNIIISVETNG